MASVMIFSLCFCYTLNIYADETGTEGTVFYGSIITLEDGSSAMTSNIDRNNYSTWASTVRSYLTETEDGSLLRVETPGGGSDIIIEYIDRDGTVLSSRTLPCELDHFCGFFAGSGNYYIVYGQNNPYEDNNRTVLRVVKYDFSFNRIAECDIKGANTYIPVDAGSLRMAESDKVLYIYTCHEMYKTSDGYHHQSNMTFEIYKDDMRIKDSFYGILNPSAGYISHSFNQFISLTFLHNLFSILP